MSDSSNSIYGGAATGAASGAIMGSAAGGVGAVPGAFIGGLLGAGAGYFGYKANQSANAANAQQAAEQMQFQERMSNTAHQREVADLRNAGINPITTASGGSGSSSPGGTSAIQTSSNPSEKALAHIGQIASVKSVVDANQRAQDLQPQIKDGLIRDNVNKSVDADLKGVQLTTSQDTQAANIASANQTYANLLKSGSLLDKELGVKDKTLQKMSEEIQGLSTANARQSLQLQRDQSEQEYNLKQGEFKSKYKNFLVPTQIGAETIGTAFGGANSALKAATLLKGL